MNPLNLNYYNTGVTVELGELLESGFNLWGFDYPVPRETIDYNEKTCKVDFDRERLQQKIVDRYRFRQIGQETPARFWHYFKTRMIEIMPYYVQMYEFDAKFRNIEDPLESYNLFETFEENRTGSGSISGSSTSLTDSETLGSSETTSNGVRKFHNTPQSGVDHIDRYLTELTNENNSGLESSESSASVSSSGSSDQTTEDSGNIQHTLTRRGNIGVQPLGGEVENIRAAFINIDQMIVDEFNDLFLAIY